MTMRYALTCAAMLAFASVTWAAEKPTTQKKPAKAAAKPSKTAAKAANKPAPKAVKAAAKKPAKTVAHVRTGGIVNTSLKRSPAPVHAQPHVLRGKTEVLTCRDGSEDRHARIALVLVGGKPDGFAYYSKWKPRTCSIYLQRNRDPYSKWSDSAGVTSISTEKGQFLVEHKKNEYRLVFRDVDRERYCGMDGTINGSLTIRKGSEHCEIAGIMEEGVPLGQAYAQLDQGAQGATQSGAEPAQTTGAAQGASSTRGFSPLGFFARLFHRGEDRPAQPREARAAPAQTPFPAAAVGLSD